MSELLIKRKSAKFLRAFENELKLQAWFAEDPSRIGVAMVGRSNVGKSSLINSLFGNKTAKTSKTPGRTQAINVFEFQLENDERSFYLYDLPGYGFAKVSREMLKNWQVLMESFFLNMPYTTLILNLQDARNPHQKSDQAFYGYLSVEQLEVYLVFNKMDKLKKQSERAQLDKLKKTIYKEYTKVKQIFYVSAEKKTNMDVLEQSVVNFLNKMDAAINP